MEMQSFWDSDLVQCVLQMHLPRYGELPSLELYMDQVISVIDDALRPLSSAADAHILTPTMINNYVKQRVVSPPVRKRYTRTHLAYFLVVALLKPVFSIAQISMLIRRQTQCSSVEAAYDHFCSELECALAGAFGSRQLVAEPPETLTADTELLRSAVLSLANKIYVEKYLEFAAMQAAVPQASGDSEKTPLP